MRFVSQWLAVYKTWWCYQCCTMYLKEHLLRNLTIRVVQHVRPCHTRQFIGNQLQAISKMRNATSCRQSPRWEMHSHWNIPVLILGIVRHCLKNELSAWLPPSCLVWQGLKTNIWRNQVLTTFIVNSLNNKVLELAVMAHQQRLLEMSDEMSKSWFVSGMFDLVYLLYFIKTYTNVTDWTPWQ